MTGLVHVLMIGLAIMLLGRGIGNWWMALAGALTATGLAILTFGLRVATAFTGSVARRVVPGVMAMAARTDAG